MEQKLLPPYQYAKPPLGKQRDVIERHWHEPYWAVLGRPGTGKTKMCLDHAGLLYAAGRIEGLIVVAPAGVESQWYRDAMPVHMSPAVPYLGGTYTSGMGKRAYEGLFQRLRSRDMGLRVLTIAFEALQTPRGKEIARALATAYRCMIVVDESHRVSNTKGAGHKAVKTLARMCRYRRIATGTLFKQNPFSAYGQFELMGDGLLGFATLPAFKSMYAAMLPPTHGLVRRIAADFKAKTGRAITPQIQEKDELDRPIYRNLAHLRTLLERNGSIISLADLGGTEPTVLTSTRVVELTADQQLLYDQLRDDGFAHAPGGFLSAPNGLALATRLCQVVGGFVPSDDDPNAQPVPGANPLLASLVDYIEELGTEEKVVVWAKYTAEIAAITEQLNALWPGSAVRYDGTISAKDKADAKNLFITEPRVRYFVGQIKAGGTGLDGLQTVCRYMFFYSNDYAYLDREQAIARLARTGGPNVVSVTDISVPGTVYDDIVRCMQTAQDVHAAVLFPNAVKNTLAPV